MKPTPHEYPTRINPELCIDSVDSIIHNSCGVRNRNEDQSMFILNLHFWIAYRLNTRPVYVGIGIYQIIFGLILIFGYDWFVRNPIGIPMLIGGNLFFVLVTILLGRFATISFDEEYDGKDYFRKPKDWKEEWF